VTASVSAATQPAMTMRWTAVISAPLRAASASARLLGAPRDEARVGDVSEELPGLRAAARFGLERIG
jgi:hypothetical protein